MRGWCSSEDQIKSNSVVVSLVYSGEIAIVYLLVLSNPPLIHDKVNSQRVGVGSHV